MLHFIAWNSVFTFSFYLKTPERERVLSCWFTPKLATKPETRKCIQVSHLGRGPTALGHLLLLFLGC